MSLKGLKVTISNKVNAIEQIFVLDRAEYNMLVFIKNLHYRYLIGSKIHLHHQPRI